MKTILHIDASARSGQSNSRALSAELVSRLKQEGDEVLRTDLAEGLPLITEAMIDAYYTAPDQRSPTQQQVIAESDALVDQLEQSDVLVLGVPMYNFTAPASFKAWVDLVARVGRTFRYTSEGPQGLLSDRPTYVAVASGGVAIGSEADFLTPYLRHVLAFMGIRNVKFITAEQINAKGEESLTEARERIDALMSEAA